MRILPQLLGMAVCISVAGAATSVPRTAKPNWSDIHHEGTAAFQAGNYEGAETIFRFCWASALTDIQHELAANDIAQSMRNEGRDGEARKWFETSLRYWEKSPENSAWAAQSATSLGDVLRGLGEYESSEKVHERALVYPRLADDSRCLVMNAYADLLREEGQFVRAMELFEAVVGMPDVPAKRKMDALVGMGDIKRHNTDYAGAVEDLREAAAIAESAYDVLAQATALRALAQTYMEQKMLAYAEPLLRRANAMLEAGNASSQQRAMALACLGDLYRLEGKFALAEDAWTRTLELERPALGETHPQVALILQQLAELYSKENRNDLAQEYADRSYRMVSSRLGETSPASASALAMLAVVEARGKHLDAAATHFEKSIAALRLTGLGHDRAVGVLLGEYAGVLKGLHRDREAKEVLLQAKSFKK